MKNGLNLASADAGDKVTIGRMKGKISIGAKIYKLTSKSLFTTANSSLQTLKISRLT